MYEATYTVPGGRHEYGVRVDGQNADPADAPAYVPDGFGGRSGVFNVDVNRLYRGSVLGS